MTSFVSTRGAGPVTFAEALLEGLAPDGGLYVPASPGELGSPPDSPRDFAATSRWVGHALLHDAGVGEVLDRIVDEALDFPLPLVEVEDGVWVLELFHGPSHAFKDVGARFMARAVRHLAPGEAARTVLVATSGDTGGAVASAFHGLDGYRVVVLFPEQGISERQRRQMTTLGGNVRAVAVDGTFDDCQRLAKQALADPALRQALGLTSANSVNVGRLIPQCFYYVHAAAALGWDQGPATFVVPSGNLGNLCAGLLAHRAGMPAAGFVAASNVNDVFPEYLRSGHFSPRRSTRTLSSAMDVGDPSNLERIRWLYADDRRALARDVVGISSSDEETRACIAEVFRRTGYVLDPHGAVAFRALEKHGASRDGPAVVLATAHPAKFPEVVEEATGEPVTLPGSLPWVLAREERFETMAPDYRQLADLLVAEPAR